MSFAYLPIELLIEIVGHLRPDDESKPITGLNAAWRKAVNPPPLPQLESTAAKAPTTRKMGDEQESQLEPSKPLAPYAPLYALAS